MQSAIRTYFSCFVNIYILVINMKGIKSYMIAGIIFVSVLGTLLHFVYSLSGNNFFVGLFTPINESIWEHTKLIYFPMLIYSLYLNKKLKDCCPCIFSAMIFGAISGVISIITFFYTYSGIIGFNIAFADITIFYISVILSFYIAYNLTLSHKSDKFKIASYIFNIIMICLFIIFTILPPNIPLFMFLRYIHFVNLI